MRRHLLVLLIILVSFGSKAQVISNSPFSYYGIGEVGGLDHAVAIGMGNSTSTMLDSSVVNFYNPASYNLLAKGQPLFSISGSSRLSTYTENGSSNFNSVTSIQHFAMAFPIKEHWGLAFGLKPYSRKGYEFTERVAVGTDSLKYRYFGTGGINEVFLGLSSNIFKLGSTRMAVGANLGYLFGSSTNSRSSALITGTNEITGGVDHRAFRARSFHYDLGTYITHDFSKTHSLTLAATADLQQNLNGTFDYGRFFAANVEDPISYDTLQYIGDTANRITTASTINIGLRYVFTRQANEKENKRLNSQLAVHVNYGMSNWSNFNAPFDSSGINYLNTNKYTIGFEYTPEVEMMKSGGKTRFFENIHYRLGGYYYSLPYATNGVQVTDFGTTFGFGIPITIQRSVSSVNFGFSYGQRGISDQNALREQYYGINLGISIAPGADRWFVKRRLN